MSFFTRRKASRVVQRRPEPPPVVETPPGIGADGYPTATTLFSSLGLTAGQGLVVGPNDHVFYDLTTSPSLGAITVNGKFTFDDSKAQTLTCTSFLTGPTGKTTGKADGGSNSLTFNRNRTFPLTINLTGTETGKTRAYNIDDITTSPANALKKLAQSNVDPPTSLTIETYTIARTTNTQFTVTSSVLGFLGTGTVGTLWNRGIRFLAETDIVNNRTIRASWRGYTNSSTPRSFQNDRGQVYLKGKAKTAFTKVQTTAATPRVAQGATVIPLETVPADWEVGDEVAIAPSEFYYYHAVQNDPNLQSQCEKATIVSKDATSITISTGLKRPRWGMKQWISQGANDANGRMTGSMSLTPTGYVHHVSGIAEELDERAVVANLSRSVKIVGANDAAWQDATAPFGCHTMTMGKDAVWQLEYVEVVRGGQLGRVGRYPFHWHMCSYNMPDGMGFPSDGAFIGDVDPAKQYLKGCVSNESAQHHFQIHGTCGALIEDSVGYLCNGHSFNWEDGSEERNTVRNCVSMWAKPIRNNREIQLKHHECEAANFWITNLNNNVYNCHAIMGHHTTWMSPSARCFGLSRDVQIFPRYGAPSPDLRDIWNSCSIGLQGVVNGGAIADERGAVGGNDSSNASNVLNNSTGGAALGTTYYQAKDSNGQTIRPVLLKGFVIFKCPIAYFNRVAVPEYTEFTIADCVLGGLTGAVDDGRTSKGLFIGNSQNVTSYIGSTDFMFHTAAASYHNTQVNQDCLFVNFTYVNPRRAPNSGTVPSPWQAYARDSKNGYPGQENTGNCANGTSDFYLQNPELGYMYHTGNKFLSTEPAFKSRMFSYRQLSTGEADEGSNNNSLSQADLDAQGWWGPAGWYKIPNHPYYTHGSTTQAILYDTQYVVTPDKQYGGKFLQMIGSDTNALRQHELTTQVLDNTYTPVAGAVFTLKRQLDYQANGAQFRYVNFRKNDSLRYKITIGTTTPPTGIMHFTIQNANDATDRVKVGLPYSHKPTSVGCRAGYTYGTAGYGIQTGYTEVGSLAALADNTWYWDGTHVWVGYVGGYTTRPKPPEGGNGEGPGYYKTFEQPIYPNTIVVNP
jgi:hypothetical protein